MIEDEEDYEDMPALSTSFASLVKNSSFEMYENNRSRSATDADEHDQQPAHQPARRVSMSNDALLPTTRSKNQPTMRRAPSREKDFSESVPLNNSHNSSTDNVGGSIPKNNAKKRYYSPSKYSNSVVTTNEIVVTKRDPHTMSVCIVGAGLAGTLMALLLSQMENIEISLFEKRPDASIEEEETDDSKSEFGNSTSALKRSINLALSYRGMMALQALEDKSLFKVVMEDAIRMPCRIFHDLDGTTWKQPYGLETDAIWSVSRQKLNKVLLENVKKKDNINMFFGYSLTSCDRNGSCTFTDENGDTRKYDRTSKFDLVIGADGAYSITREQMLRHSRLNFSRQYIKHGYKELSIPWKIQLPEKAHVYAMEDYQGLHIWPRGEFMMIALPNADKSFTATLFAPYSGHDGFDNIDLTDDMAILLYFERYFPDIVKYMPDLAEDFKNNPVGSLVTVRVNPFNLGKIVLIGDAAHAVVPFYGQGMNAALEDCLMLYTKIRAKTSNIEKALADFSAERSVSTNTLADLCLEHYHDMAAKSRSILFTVKKKVETFLFKMFPSKFLPMYSMIAFSNTPYNIALERANNLDKLVENVLLVGTGAIITLTALTAYYFRESIRSLSLFNK